MEDERKHDYKIEFNGLFLLDDVGRYILYSRRTAVKVILFLPQLYSSVYNNSFLVYSPNNATTYNIGCWMVVNKPFYV